MTMTMALTGSGKTLVFFLVLTVALMIINLVEVSRLPANDTGVKVDKALSGIFLAVASTLLIFAVIRGVCGRGFGPTSVAVCAVLQRTPMWKMLNGAFK